MRSERQEYQKQKKKNRKWKRFFTTIFILFAAVFAYGFYQYKQGVSQSTERANVQKVDYEFNGDVDQEGGTNILLLGSDSRGEEKARADTIMVARYHPDNGTYKLISFMRDTYLEIPGYGQGRINTAFLKGGPELVRETLKANFGLDLQYYAIVDFEGFVQLVDEAFPEGLEIDVEKRMSKNIGVTLEPGLQRLDGKHLLGYVRFRQDAVGDFGRVERQQKVVKKIAEELTSIQSVPKLPKLVGVVTPFVNTNMDAADMVFIGKDFITSGNREISSLRVPVDGAWQNANINGASVLAIDVQKNREAIQGFISK
ncbi:LCP family protein [Bacillus sp. 31A1R]|uniref:Regulatory protein MsrR n=1 Tax=Robertmurraya mangrovi TaxID=3098077 RepID=A0ABU5ISW7_9BACI|nr:LCP family protein [Bacillus sp. 31A1R]MDZ5470242.1 LCP family protein [Bacillus sp. 31A1R]